VSHARLVIGTPKENGLGLVGKAAVAEYYGDCDLGQELWRPA
jgi:hypothetical protein